MKQENILILFNGGQLTYSPSIMQLYEELDKIANVTIFAEYIENFIAKKITDKNVIYFVVPEYIKPPFIKKISYFFLRRFNKYAKRLEAAGLRLKVDYPHFLIVKNLLKTGNYDRIISVDMRNLFYCSVLDIKTDFFSLELGASENLLPFINTKVINCVLTQSIPRYQYLFKKVNLLTFLIPNAPTYFENKISLYKNGLLYGGTAWEPFGFFHCLDYLRKYKDTTLTVQGAYPFGELEKIKIEYAELIEENLLVLNENFLENEAVVTYFSNFEIGICFYNFEVKWIQHFNYQSAPSGKVFKYLAAGVPVIAIDVIGFKFIEEMECGVLIPDLNPESIRKGIEKIRSNYKHYALNTIKAAKSFSFDKAVLPYINYVKNTPLN